MTDSYDPYDDYDPQDDANSRLRGRIEGLLKDVVKKTVSQGVGAKALTEDTIRAIVGEMKMPKEAVAYIITTADTVKTELVRVAATEFREFLESANLGEELAKILTSLSFEIRTEIRFIPNEEAVKPNVKSRMTLKNAQSGETISEEDGSSELDAAIRSSVAELARGLLGRNKSGSTPRVQPSEESRQEAAPEAPEEAAGAPAASRARPNRGGATRKKAASTPPKKGTV